jgi:hypothetical protein
MTMRDHTRHLTWRRATALGVAGMLAMLLTAAVQAGGPVVRVTGSYEYVVFEGGPGRTVEIDAHGTDPVKGSWAFNDRLSGDVTCLVVDGDQAFMFGPGTVGGRGAFFWVRDGAARGGAEDEAITWIQDLPTDELPPEVEPQTLTEMEGWCLNAGEGFPGLEDPGLVPLTGGNLTIH